MSFDHLMKHANDIQAKAIRNAKIDQVKNAPPVYPDGIEGYYSYIPSMFEPFSQMPDPASYDHMIGNMDKSMANLCTLSGVDPFDKDHTCMINTDMSLGATDMSDWNGKAANLFKERFVEPFPKYSQNQFTLVATVKSGLLAYQAKWAAARRDIDELAHSVENALDLTGTQMFPDKNKWEIQFTVLASITAVGAAILALGTPPTSPVGALALTAIGAYAQTRAVDAPPDLPEKRTLQGETAYQITNEMTEALNKINQTIDAADEKIAAGFARTLQDITDSRRHLIANRPALADQSSTEIRGYDGLGPPQ